MHGVYNRLELQEKRTVPDRWVDEVGGSGVYPTSEARALEDSEVHGMASWGQGERGARGYHDHGDSELHLKRTEEH